ncbi:hypothetical protein [Paramicrobacterium chengjingii]|uniref:Transposase n=1 Tax=Paramicrobacterium chengjingii TaxID=2769067 RepID=A0ABX6YGE8_9MICO|nr:hypothetical protein [Microbacterium chengjingii]QPZ37516.1 hypothetical protein HCR76_11805 [Microbacterium chengjingii]
MVDAQAPTIELYDDTYYEIPMALDADWRHRGNYIMTRHGVAPEEANDAPADPDAITFTPDPASVSGRSVRVIGRATSTSRLLTVIVLDDGGVRHGVNSWPANSTDKRRYLTGGDTP